MRKHHILYILIAIVFILELVFIENNNSNNYVFALSYENNIGIGFTINPSLSLSISSSDLVIDSLTPGAIADSNSINVSVSTNTAYGYTLSAATDSNDLVRSDNVDSVFSSISTNANLESLTTDNTWGYTSKLGSESTWSNYSGLSNNVSKVLYETKNAADSKTIDFKISAKASNTQPSGIYINTINFTVVSKLTPITLAEAYESEGKTMINGFYTMQDMNSTICEKTEAIGSQLQVLDIRDYKLYWISKLADNHCWMTQNLDLDLSSNVALTSENTDLSTDISLYVQNGADGPYALDSGYAISTVNNKTVVSWTPERSTYTSVSAPGSQNWAGDTGDNTTSGYYHPYSWNRIANNNGDPVYPDSTVTEAVAGNHAQSGNYYNWSAAVASNYSYAASGSQKNSICPSSWRLPVNGEYGTLYNAYKTTSSNNNAYGLMAEPLWFVRSGRISSSGGLGLSGSDGYYWSSTVYSSTNSYSLYLNNTYVSPAHNFGRFNGFSVRCLSS